MIGTPFHALLFAIAAGVGVVGLRQDKGAVAGIGIAIAAVLFLYWLRYCGVTAAGRHYRAGRTPSAWRELSLVPFGGCLMEKSHRAYFRLLRAAVLLDRHDWDAVLIECQAVLDIEGIKSANHATAHSAMGQAEVRLGNHAAAKEHVRIAKSLPHKPATDRTIARVERELAEAHGGR